MRIAIFGASGRTGRQLVEQAMTRDREVTAIVRNPDGLPSDLRGGVRVVKPTFRTPTRSLPPSPTLTPSSRR
jgi:uncharacterized protein YbjT (DUF2867 family)